MLISVFLSTFTEMIRFAKDETLPAPFLSLTYYICLPHPSITSSSSLSHVTHLLSSLYPFLSDLLSLKGVANNFQDPRGRDCNV